MKAFLKRFSLFLISSIFFSAITGCEQSGQLEEKFNQTFQNSLEDSGLKETLQSHIQTLEDFLESNKTQKFIEQQSQISQEITKELTKIIESNATKEILQKQMENLNNILQ